MPYMWLLRSWHFQVHSLMPQASCHYRLNSSSWFSGNLPDLCCTHYRKWVENVMAHFKNIWNHAQLKSQSFSPPSVNKTVQQNIKHSFPEPPSWAVIFSYSVVYSRLEMWAHSYKIKHGNIWSKIVYYKWSIHRLKGCVCVCVRCRRWLCLLCVLFSLRVAGPVWTLTAVLLCVLSLLWVYWQSYGRWLRWKALADALENTSAQRWSTASLCIAATRRGARRKCISEGVVWRLSGSQCLDCSSSDVSVCVPVVFVL